MILVVPRWLRRALVFAAWAGAAGVGFFVAAGLSFYLALHVERRTTQIVVPDFTGLERAEAERLASARQLALEVVDERHDPAVARGRVVQQEPRSGAAVRRGRKVKIVLSLGGRVLEIPEVVGTADRQVRIRLVQDGLAVGDEARVHSRRADAGSVLAQVPPAGSPAVPGARVHRLVSEGPRVARWVMPSLEGRPLATVESWIEMCGFRRGPVRRLDDTGRPPGTVIGQLPRAGYPVQAKEIVELTVAR